MPRSRNLVVCCDGTWNAPDQISDGGGATNVQKFFDALSETHSQYSHYESGVGTRAFEQLSGGIYGYGLEKRIQGGYRFLRKRFADKEWASEENRIFIVGFSRGAYTARRLAGLIHHSGIPARASDADVGWEVYKERDTETAEQLKNEGRFFDVPIEMVGVWDTVKATNDPSYNDSRLSPNVRYGYHAMAIDERRKPFPVLRWRKDSRVLQLWFAGVHSDVGGGYAASRLSDVPLRWMIERGVELGLRFKASWVRNNVRPLATGRIHESYEGIWEALGERRRKIAATDLIHHSVEKRLASGTAYTPPNLPPEPIYWRPNR